MVRGRHRVGDQVDTAGIVRPSAMRCDRSCCNRVVEHIGARVGCLHEGGAGPLGVDVGSSVRKNEDPEANSERHKGHRRWLGRVETVGRLPVRCHNASGIGVLLGRYETDSSRGARSAATNGAGRRDRGSFSGRRRLPHSERVHADQPREVGIDLSDGERDLTRSGRSSRMASPGEARSAAVCANGSGIVALATQSAVEMGTLVF